MAEPYVHDEIRLGSFLLTIVEPHRGHEVAYNRWYERDHFYSGCMIGPWNLTGGRFVATRDCKARRKPEPSPGSYMALYWVQDGKYPEWVEWAGAQVGWLHKNGRMFEERDHIHTQMYKFRGAVAADPDPVPPELALDHRYPGVVAVFGEVDEGGDPMTAVLDLPSVGQCVVGTPRPLQRGPADVPRAEGSDRRFAHLYFLNGDPLEAWDADFEKAVGDIPGLTFASPFLATIPGTDTYTDQLW
jgi:hypothetical protein